MVKKILKNKIYIEDFGSLEIESLKIDYLRFNLKSYLNDSEISNLAVYFRRLGFSSYKKELDNIKERTAIFNDKYFEVTFVLRTPYYEGTHLEFAGESANHLYSFIKNNKFNWNQLEQYGTFLRLIDTCYDAGVVPAENLVPCPVQDDSAKFQRKNCGLITDQSVEEMRDKLIDLTTFRKDGRVKLQLDMPFYDTEKATAYMNINTGDCAFYHEDSGKYWSYVKYNKDEVLNILANSDSVKYAKPSNSNSEL